MLDSFARGTIVCSIFVTLAPLGLAQPPDARPLASITLPEALSRTLERNASLRARGLELNAAEGRLLQSTFRPNPELRAVLEDTLGTDRYRGFDSSEATITLGWMLERGVRERIVDAARARVDLSAVEIEIARLDAAAETARRFIACLVYQDRHRTAETGVNLARDAVEAVQRRVEASRAPEAELARAEAELARAELRLEDYEHELLSAYHRLGAQWSETEPDFAAVEGDLSSMPPPEPLAALLARVEQNPDITSFVSQHRLAEAELSLARARSRTSWELSGGLRRIEATDDWALVGGVTIPLRLGNRNQGRIGETQARADQVDAESQAARIAIETELFVIYQELKHNVELAARLEADVAPRYEAALADMRRAFELGRSSYLEFRAVQTELLDTRYEILDAHADAYRLSIEIERLTGESLAASPASE